jgi:hypothetical protein
MRLKTPQFTRSSRSTLKFLKTVSPARGKTRVSQFDCLLAIRYSAYVSVHFPLYAFHTLSSVFTDPAVYPAFDLYPAFPEDCAPSSRQPAGVSVRLTVAYPIFNLCKATCPFLLLFLTSFEDSAVYPLFEIYPSLPEDCAPGCRPQSGIFVRLAVAYPVFDLCMLPNSKLDEFSSPVSQIPPCILPSRYTRHCPRTISYRRHQSHIGTRTSTCTPQSAVALHLQRRGVPR